MTILFICGSIEQERDGVGDYTRRLAGELIRQGYCASILAINDGYVSEIYKENQYDLDTKITVYRLPKFLTIKEKQGSAKDFIDEMNPEYLSLQYVPFSFDDRGLPFSWNKVFQTIGQGRKWQIMFHELWIGIDQNKLSWQHKILKKLQQKIILNLSKNLEVNCYTTQALIYQKQLLKHDIKSELLPLFGNIPFAPLYQNEQLITSYQIDLTAFNILYFGSAPDRHLSQLIIDKLIAFKENFDGKWNLIYVGKASAKKENFLATIKQYFDKLALGIIDLGHVNSEDLSRIISNSSIGIARSSLSLLGKSGSAIAMLEHGLSIWLPKAEEGTIQNIDYPFRRNLIFDTLFNAYEKSKTPKTRETLLPQIAEKLLRLFNQKPQLTHAK